jgi:hypothetical protein
MLEGSKRQITSRSINQRKEKIRKGRACIFLKAKRAAEARAKRLITMSSTFISGLDRK